MHKKRTVRKIQKGKKTRKNNKQKGGSRSGIKTTRGIRPGDPTPGIRPGDPTHGIRPGDPTPGIRRGSATRTAFRGMNRYFSTGLPAAPGSYMTNSASRRAKSYAQSILSQPKFTKNNYESFRNAALKQPTGYEKFSNLPNTYGNSR